MKPKDIELTVQEVLDWVENIRQMAGDSEAAHTEEDALYGQVLYSIAIGNCENPAQCAEAALRSKQIEFERWCA